MISKVLPIQIICVTLIAEAIIILKRKNLINIYFPHRIQLTRAVDETSFVVAYVNVCGK